MVPSVLPAKGNVMSIIDTYKAGLKTASVGLLLAASATLWAGPTVKITNTSTPPWCLRITEDTSGAIMAQSSRQSTPVELGPRHKLVFYIQPGETCILQCKDMKDLPMKKDIGLVDQNGTEQGSLRLQSRSLPDLKQPNPEPPSGDGKGPGPQPPHPKPAPSQPQPFCADLQPAIESRVLLQTEKPGVLHQDADDAVRIIGDCYKSLSH